MEIIEFLKIVRTNLWLIILFPLCVAIVSAFVAYNFIPDEFTSFMTVYVVPHTGSDTTANRELYMNRNDTYFDWSNELSASQMVTNDVSKLVKSNRVKDSVEKDLNIKNLDDYKIEVESSEKNRIIYFKVTALDAVMATKVVESVTNNVAKVAKDVLDLESVNIVDSPTVPDKPSGPLRWFIVLISTAIGFLLAIFIMYIREILANKIKSTNDLKRMLELPILAKFPKV